MKSPKPQLKPVVATIQRNVSRLVQVRTSQGLKLYHLAGVIIAQGGVLPNIQAVLLPKKTEKASAKSASQEY